MLRLTELKMPLEHSPEELRAAVLKRLELPETDLLQLQIFRRGVDARKPDDLKWIYTLDVRVRQEQQHLRRLKKDRRVSQTPDMRYRFVAQTAEVRSERPVVIGMGPAGMMAGLILAQAGFRPLILERGKIVRERTKDTFALWRKGILTPESNVQFGEGGAGTFSDGKLYSRIQDPKHYGRKVLEEFVKAGAPEEILYVSKPHIGTFRLVSMVESMRAAIEALGGTYRFQSKVADILVDAGANGSRRVRGVALENGETIAEGAARETWEEAEANVRDLQLYTVYNIPYISQVYMLHRAELVEGRFGVGVESLECRLFSEDEIPWDELAFPSVKKTLRHYFEDRRSGHFPLHVEDIRPRS